MQVLLSAATPFELAPILSWLENNFESPRPGDFAHGNAQIQVRITGIGVMATAWNLAQYFSATQPDLCINAGIGGALDKDLRIGDVLYIQQEQLADLGAENADGATLDVFDLGLLDPNSPPFQNRALHNPDALQSHFLAKANGITVQRAHGSAASIEHCRAKYPDAQIESMEGAAFFYACLLTGQRFMELRAVSNYVTPRNRDEWDLPTAISQLNTTLKNVFSGLIEL